MKAVLGIDAPLVTTIVRRDFRRSGRTNLAISFFICSAQQKSPSHRPMMTGVSSAQ